VERPTRRKTQMRQTPTVQKLEASHEGAQGNGANIAERNAERTKNRAMGPSDLAKGGGQQRKRSKKPAAMFLVQRSAALTHEGVVRHWVAVDAMNGHCSFTIPTRRTVSPSWPSSREPRERQQQ